MDERKLREALHRTRPAPPEGFAGRIDHELVRLQAGKEAGKMRKKLPLAALVAIIIAALTAFGAIAATVAGNLLKDTIGSGGAQDAARQVQDVRAAQSADGFGFTVEQCYWEGDTLCLSWTATVPDDGQPYLLGLEMPRLNGERLHGEGYYIDDELSGYLTLMGGDHMTAIADVLRLTAYASQTRDSGNAVTVRAAFMTPNRLIRRVSAAQYQRLLGEGAYTDELPEDGFFYIDAEAPEPVLSLAELKPVQEHWLASEETEQRLTAETLEALGLVRLDQRFEVTADVDDARYDGPIYQGLTQDVLRFKGYTVEVRQFKLTHLNCSMALTVTPDDDTAPEAVPTDFALALPDGAPLISNGKGWISFARWNGTAYNVRCEGTGVLAIGGAESFLLVPMAWQGGEAVPILDDAVPVVPTRDQPRDEGTVWATPMGNYYHADRYCMGMEGAEPTTVQAAEAAGKKACMVCVG